MNGYAPRQIAQALRAQPVSYSSAPLGKQGVFGSSGPVSVAPAQYDQSGGVSPEMKEGAKAFGEWLGSPSETADDFTGPPQDTWGNAYKIGASGDGGIMGGLGGMWDKFGNTGGFSSGGAGGGGMGTYLGYANMAKDGFDIFNAAKNVDQKEGGSRVGFGDSAMGAGKGALSGFQAGGPVGAIVGAALGNEKSQWEGGNREFMKSPKGILKSELTGGTGARDLEGWFGLKMNPMDWF